MKVATHALSSDAENRPSSTVGDSRRALFRFPYAPSVEAEGLGSGRGLTKTNESQTKIFSLSENSDCYKLNSKRKCKDFKLL